MSFESDQHSDASHSNGSPLAVDFFFFFNHTTALTLPNSSGGGSGGGGFSTGIGGALPLELQMIVAINARILLLVVLLPALLIVVVIVM